MPGLGGINGLDPLPSEIADDDLVLVDRGNFVYSTPVLQIPEPLTPRRQLVAPLLSDFPTAVNFLNLNDVTQLDDGIRMYADRRHTDQIAARVRPLPGAWSVTLGVVKGFRHGNTQAGLILRESATGKLMFHSYGVSSVPGWFISRYTNPTTFGAVVVNYHERGQGIMWQRFTLNGSNIEYYISVDGLSFKHMGSVAQTTPFTTTPDQWGFYMNNSNAFLPTWLDIIDWDE